jgi:hypothetical protein
MEQPLEWGYEQARWHDFVLGAVRLWAVSRVARQGLSAWALRAGHLLESDGRTDTVLTAVWSVRRPAGLCSE